MARVYATEAQLAAYGAPAGVVLPTGADALRQLTRASELVDLAIITAVYDTDTVTGLPTATAVTEALRDATCAQVAYWAETGDQSGTGGQWQSVKIGSVSLTGSSSGQSGTSSGRQLAEQAWTHIRLAGLLPGAIIH